jgi:uncharacterized protein YjiS (DUF1127 family)
MNEVSLWAPNVPQVFRRWRLRSWPGRLAASLRVWRERRASRDELAKLDPRMLRDIGVTPAEAWLEINKPFWKE